MSAALEQKLSYLWESLQSDSPQRDVRAAETASDIYSLCIEQITDAELAYCSSVLLNQKNGVTKFLQDSAGLDEFVNCKDELLHLLHDYVKSLGKKVLPYAVGIKDVCLSLFSRDRTAKVKNSTFPLLITVLELCGRSEYVDSLNIPKLAEKYFNAALQPTKHTATVRCGIYHLLGVLCEQFPEHMVPHSSRLVDIYVRTLKAEMVTKKGKKPELPVISGCLKGLTAYLHSFTQSASESSIYAQDIYNFTRRAIDPEASLTRYDVPRAGLSLLAKHAAQFKEYLAKDTEHMYSSLYSWCSHNNRECKLIGLQAMESFFQQISNQIAESGDRAASVPIYREFMKRFRGIIDNPDTRHKELAVAIKGYGYFAKPCKVYGTLEDLQYMFSEMVQRSEQMFLAKRDNTLLIEEVLFHLPTFMVALASISKEIEELPEGFLLSLERLVILLFEYYPRIPLHVKLSSSIALLRLLMAVATIPTTFQQFLSHIVFQGLVRSCSHPVVIEAGDGSTVVSIEQPALEESGYKVASYVDYIELWTQLMDSKRLKGLGIDYSSHELRQRIHSLAYNEFVLAVLAVLKKLDLSSTTQQEKFGDDGSSVSDTSETATSDPVAGLHPTVPKDFQIFINLVDLCRKLLPSVTPNLFCPWVLTFSREVIAMATQYPLVSGFYKLLACVLRICKRTNYFKGIKDSSTGDNEVDKPPMETDHDDDVKICFLLFRKFIKEVIVRMQQYKDDLLSSCLQMVLTLPEEMVLLELDSLIPAIELALKLGVGYLPLAKAVLDALETWMQKIPLCQLSPMVMRLLPSLDDYLQTSVKTGSSDPGDTSRTVTISSTTSRSSKGKRFPVKVLTQWKEGMEVSGNELSRIRERILYLLGSLGGVVNAALLEREASGALMSHAVAWDTKNKLEFPVPYSDLKPTIFLDPFLPRVCELAVSSSDRQTKVAACEFLHAAVLFILGKSAQQATERKSPMTRLYRKLFPVLLQLGCDIERVAEQLFRPLVLQMIHWFTRNTQYESPDTITLLEAILEGIEHPSNTSLRDFCAQCVKEFLKWSIKQTSKKQQERSPINTKSLLKRIYSMASHPSATKRLGAGLALNSIYTVFREETSLVDMFVMEMLVVMINSLKIAHRDNSSLGTVDQCSQAIGHIARIMRVKSALLSSPSKNRRIPRGFKSAEMFNLVTWLLSQTGSSETEARLQCIQLFNIFAPLASKVPNTRIWIRRTIESENGFYFVSRFEKGTSSHGGILKYPTLNGSLTITEIFKWMDYLQAALDCYIWVLKDQLISPSEVFSVTPVKPTDKPSQLFTSIDFFLTKMSLRGLEGVQEFLSSSSSIFSPHEEEQYGVSRSSVVSRILRFAEILLEKHTHEAVSCIPSTFWNQCLYDVVFAVLFNLSSLGIQYGDIKTTQKLIEEGVKVVKAMITHLPQDRKADVISYFAQIMGNTSHNLIKKLPIQITDTNFAQQHIIVDRLLQGHLHLAQGDVLKEIFQQQKVDVSQTLDKILTNVLEVVKMTGDRDSDQAVGGPAQRHTVELLLKLALYLMDDVCVILQVILGQSKGADDGNGLMLYLTFSDVLNTELINRTEPVITTLLHYSNSLPYVVSTLLNGMIDFALKDKTLRKEKLPLMCSILISHWSQLDSWWRESSKSLDNKLAAVTLLQKLFNAQPKLLETVTEDQLQTVVNMYCKFVGDPHTSLNFKSKVLEVLSPFLSLSKDNLDQLRTSLNSLVAHQFPLNSSELPPGSPMFNEYISIMDRLLGSLISSGSHLLLELIINITCREKRHVHEENIQTCLAKFITELPTAAATEALNLSYNMFINERDYPSTARRGIGERVCLTLIRECNTTALVEFFTTHIVEMMEILETKVLRTTDSDLEGQLISKLCCFQFIEVLYTRLTSSFLSSTESKINSSYCKGNVKTGKELTQAITKCGHTSKSEDLHRDKTHYDLRRQYHCYAYNMLIAVICCTQNKPQFYIGFLFKEDLTKGQYLWDNLIDGDKFYQFQIELEEPIKRKKQMMTIRDERRQTKRSPDGSSSLGLSPPFPVRYISSLYLADSSLSTDVSQYDFSFNVSHVTTGSVAEKYDTKSSSYIISEEQLEEDDLNNHECMVSMMKLLDHMQHNKITPEVDKGNLSPDMPQWMSLMHKKMTDGSTDRNIRLFIARLIVNRSKIFQPYAKHWLTALTQLIISGSHGGEGLHYYVVDIIVTMLSWTPTAVLEDRYLASRILEYIMSHCHHDNRSILRNNLEITRTLVECWKDHIQVPTKLIYNHFSNSDRASKNNRTGIQLLGIVVANDLPPYDSATASSVDEQSYYSTFVLNMSNKYKEVYGATAEILGMLLSQMQEKNHPFMTRLQELVTDRLSVLAQPAEQSEDRLIMCLHRIHLHYPRIVERFVEKLLFILPMLQGTFRSHCLEILQSQADIQTQFYLKLKDKGFHNMLSHRDEATQMASLKIVQGMLHQLSNDDISQLLPYLTAFATHSSVQCRVTMYNVLMTVYNNLCSDDSEISVSDSTSKHVLTEVRNQLLVGLSDEAEEIKLKMYEFWNQESNLVSSTLGRLSNIFATLYSAKTEQHFLYHATNLLLELTSRSPDFNRSIFDVPLSECKFEDYKTIDLSWQQRHLQMTPLFAATQASQSGSQPDSDVSGMETGALRATQQSLAFTPTQEPGYSWMTPAAQSMDSSASFTIGTSSQSSEGQSDLLFTRPSPLKHPLRVSHERLSKTLSDETSTEEEKRKQILKLKRRFLKSKETTSAFFAKSEARKKVMREEHRKHQKAARQSYVVMYRKYRDGELPDIQIKHSEIIRPLQALAQHDSGLARRLFGSLFCAIFSEVDHHLNETEAENTKTAMKQGINIVLESSTQFYSPFIGSLQDICYKESQLSLNPSLITTASLVSRQELIGIMLLEKQLLKNVTQSSNKGSKRSKGSHVSEATETWVESARLYKSVGDYDILRGIFSNLEGTQEITRKALEAEERGDYLEALGLYKEAMGIKDWNTQPTEVEEDLWEDSLLNCYSHLTEWKDLETASTNNIDDHTPPRLDSVWSDTYYQEHYLPFILQSKLKLWSIEGSDRGFGVFLEKSLREDDTRQLMESRYPEQVALYYIMKGDMDRAQYYLSISLQAFLQDWSTGGDQMSKVYDRIQCLQRLKEMNEFLNFVSHPGNFESKKPLDVLLGKWRSRYPDPKLDSIPVWDNIVTNRSMMLKKILDKFQNVSFNTESEMMDVDGGSISLDKIISMEYTNMYMKIADAACIQSNYAVAKKYLHLVEKSIQQDFSDDDVLQLKWLHSIAKMRLQQMNQDRSPSRCETVISLACKLGEFKSAPLMSRNKPLASQHHSIEGKTLTLLAELFATPEDGTIALSALSQDVSNQLNIMTGLESTSSPTATKVAEKLWLRALSSLNSSIKVGTTRNPLTGKAEPNVTSLVEMASFCDNILRQEDDDVITGLDTQQFPSVVIAHTLKAMSLGSNTALEQFPRLLQLVEYYPETTDQFIKKSSDVPCWMFIGWINQMVALLDKKEGQAVADILLEIADTYPESLYYPFKVSSSGFKFDKTPEGRKNRENVERLREKLRNQLVDDFVTALEQLNSPELVWKDLLDNEIKPLLDQTIPKRNKAAISKAWKQLYEQVLDTDPDSSPSSLFGSPSLQKGSKQKTFVKEYHKKIENLFGKDGSKIHGMSISQFNKGVGPLYEGMKQNLNKQNGPGLLKEYSPWLDAFQTSDYPQVIEVPGQYNGKSKPLPEYHAKISGFDGKILVLSSMRKPKRLTIIGDDTKEYMFLVKGGEDLRHDQRIEQLYEVMNGILCEDAACSQRQLRVKTYQVIAMTTRVGLIEWVKNTKPLKEFMMDELTDMEKKNQNAMKLHKQWTDDKHKGYMRMYKNAGAAEVEKEYRRKVATIPWDLLRRSFMHLAATPEAFVMLRSHFIKTLATANICQYILGIGDRHLSNFMVNTENGGVVPIDFGHAFHSATQFLPIPELMPFRLTPQFTNLLLPHKETGQLRSCMIHTLRALQASPSSLLNTMDVFIKEPSMDWKSNARKQAQVLKVGAGENDSLWYPREKVRVSKKKLLGYNSAHLMLVDLKYGHQKKPEFNSMKAVLMGDYRVNLRARVGEHCKNVEEQVDCLIDHATDSNILGRTWVGWEPWV